MGCFRFGRVPLNRFTQIVDASITILGFCSDGSGSALGEVPVYLGSDVLLESIFNILCCLESDSGIYLLRLCATHQWPVSYTSTHYVSLA